MDDIRYAMPKYPMDEEIPGLDIQRNGDEHWRDRHEW